MESSVPQALHGHKQQLLLLHSGKQNISQQLPTNLLLSNTKKVTPLLVLLPTPYVGIVLVFKRSSQRDSETKKVHSCSSLRSRCDQFTPLPS